MSLMTDVTWHAAARPQLHLHCQGNVIPTVSYPSGDDDGLISGVIATWRHTDGLNSVVIATFKSSGWRSISSSEETVYFNELIPSALCKHH